MPINCFCQHGFLILLFFQVRNDEESDQLATYFRCEMVPKVLITSSDRSKLVR